MNKQNQRLTNRAFSLVELSIVLVILGLLAGGVLSGQSLIRAAELRSISTDLARYNTALYAFRDKYFALPGDMNNAEQFWGTATDCSGAHSSPSTDAKTCNGNGNGVLETDSIELFRAWQQMANAGLIEGSYTGVTGALNTGDFDAGINTPKLRIGTDMGISLLYLGTQNSTGSSYMFPGSYGNVLTVGWCASRECMTAMLDPEDAWNVDTKLDDGKPGTGRVRTRVGGATPAYSSGMFGCNDAADDSASEASRSTYTMATTTKVCGFYYIQGF